MVESKVSFKSRFGDRLVGLEAIPDSGLPKYPTLVLVHGFGVTKEEYGLFDGFSRILSDNGFLVYRFDFSGRGESEGDYSETSITRLGEELKDILDWVRRRPLVDESNLGILSQSFGTSVTASIIPSAKAMVFTGSISDPVYYFEHLSRWDILDKEGISKKVKSTTGEVILIKPQFWSELKKHDLLKNISRLGCPILFIHGSADDHVPVSQMEAFYDAAKEPKQKRIIEGADHGLNPHRDEAGRLVLDWFKKYLV